MTDTSQEEYNSNNSLYRSMYTTKYISKQWCRWTRSKKKKKKVKVGFA